MNWVLLSLLPFLSAFIGWLTNYAAIKMLFRPRIPLGWGRFSIQGVVPRRRLELASRMGEIVERELLQSDFLRKQLGQVNLEPHLRKLAHKLTREKMLSQVIRVPVLGNFVSPESLRRLEDWLTREMVRQVRPMLEQMADDMQQRLPLREMVQEKILALELDQLENMIHRVAHREFQSIQWMGAILGFLVGLVQILLLFFTGQIS
ncbi:MAG: DUF445 family protein [Opitutales bacterium]|nr:DUF445 family protein [Opitutales bacterium]